MANGSGAVIRRPTLVGDCLWHHVPELASVQWLHDPGRDGALGRYANNPAERDRCLVQICGLVGPAVGVHGQGGIGQSVLAAALARHEGVRRRFPDGVFWVRVGEHADVLALQLDLLAQLGAGQSSARTVAEATAELRSLLPEKRVLLVVDDVWSAGARTRSG